MKKTLGALAIAALMYAPAALAQDHAMREGPHAPMMHRQELGISAEQAARMEAIHAELRAAHREHCEGLRAAGTDGARKEALHQRMRQSMQRTHERAAAVLTAEQRARLDSLHAAHHGPAGQHAQHGEARGAGHGSTRRTTRPCMARRRAGTGSTPPTGAARRPSTRATASTPRAAARRSAATAARTASATRPPARSAARCAAARATRPAATPPPRGAPTAPAMAAIAAPTAASRATDANPAD